MNTASWLIPIITIICAAAIAAFAHLNKLSWKYILPAIIIPNLPVAVWDYFFTDWGIWQFNQGSEFKVVLHYVSISFLCLAVFYLVKERVKTDYLGRKDWVVSIAFFLILGLLWFFNVKTTFLSIPALFSAFLMLVVFVFYRRGYTQSFFITYILMIIPYTIIKHIQLATGYLTYDSDMLTGYKIGNMPAEELVVLLAITILTVIVFQAMVRRWPLKVGNTTGNDELH